MPAEGAAAFMLEDAESARRRGAAVYGEIAGAASICVVDDGGRPRSRDAAAVRRCLGEAGWEPRSVGHLHAHGLSTRRTDADEAQAVREVFGAAADALPVVAAKSSLGDAGAGAGVRRSWPN